MSGPANRGKWAEGEVRKHLKVLEAAHASFTFNRNLDAHAAGGRFQAVPGDFQAFCLYKEKQIGPNAWVNDPHSRNFIIEVKEVTNSTRLPYKNYSEDKVARVRKREMAGTECLVLVCFLPEKVWKAVPQAFFYDRDPTKPSGSWDLHRLPLID
jgi:hypothetical protein